MKKILLSLCFWSSLNAMEGGDGGPSTDPFARTDYAKAFAPQVFKKFLPLLEENGSIINMPEDLISSENKSSKSKKYKPISNLSEEEYKEQQKLLVQAIQQQLTNAKRNAILRPLYEAFIICSVQGASTVAMLTFMPPDSVGGGFGLFSMLNLVGWVAKDAGKTLYTYYRPGNDPLQRWENKFSKVLPYIPHQLWPKIIDKFGAVRMGRYSYAQATDFFNIVFNLPTIHRYPYHPPLTLDELDNKSKVINKFIHKFFEDYKDPDDPILGIRAACKTYLQKLAKDEDGFVCIHLEGPGGIGKTHFSKKLSEQLGIALGRKIPQQEITIRNMIPSELEGDTQTPGQILLALAEVGKKKSPFGILIFDEATWLNSVLQESSKKIFEPKLGSFISQYLDGLEVSFKGFLLIFISNNPIEDKALKSRFINVKFPNLKKESLISMACKSITQYTEGTYLREEDLKNATEITEALERSTTMRDIAIEFPIAIEKIRAKQERMKEGD
ncbi:ATP-binding protein [Candidatus Odyssella acanthamoebae]|uniref:AAA+ ATPase domain-containing protein n=1 Tax=Candidatus Odyssella acanthamoebae TaxID=91604 RepID=A0A077AWH8_9PROT|nr:ATP-binding protein [Candidatus Paracaedibacter acanthamoebae]AIK96379.1 hypothetical protein ID47_05980 [Candidatus Paracaedibacter acanthamoebae]